MIEDVHFSRELVDQIIFGMENQDSTFYLDTHRSTVVSQNDMQGSTKSESPERFVRVPEWKSVDGYNLMEQFVATLHNPIFRERLRNILASGKGVFRQFKDTVRERREIERHWYTFKERHMRALVAEWFNTLREREGLERLAENTIETETDELIDIDFGFRDMRTDEVELITSLDREAFSENYSNLSDPLMTLHYREQREHKPSVDAPQSLVLVAETLGEEFAGFVWAHVMEEEGVKAAFVQQLYVLPEFRGLGVARALLAHFFVNAHNSGIECITLMLTGQSLGFIGSFEGYGLKRAGAKLTLDVEAWYRSEQLGQ